MKIILFIIFILFLVFGNWVGNPFSWLLTKIVANPYGAIIVFFLLVVSLIRLYKVFIGEFNLQNASFPRIRHKNKSKKD